MLGLILKSGKRRAFLISKKGSTTWIERERERDKEKKTGGLSAKISVLQEHGHYIKEEIKKVGKQAQGNLKSK